MRRLLLILTGMVMAITAVNARAGLEGTKRAKAVAKAIERHYHGVKTLRAIFLETYRAGQDDVRVESGTVYFRRPGLMRWDYESPRKKLFLTDGRDAWFYIPANHSATRTPMRKSADWRTPFALLTGKAKLADLCSSVSLVPSAGGPGSPPRGYRVLDCQPKKGEGFLDARIEIDPSSRIVRVLVKQPGDVNTEVQFARWQENIPLPKSLFRFVPPPGVSVVNPRQLAHPRH